MEPVFEQALVARYGFNQLEMTANGVLPGMIVIGPDNKLYEIKRVIRVPDTYDPETRTYSGTWTPSGVDFHTTTTAINAASYD